MTGRFVLVPGLCISAILVSTVGGWWGAVIGAVQAALGVALLLRPGSPGPKIGAVLALLAPPLAAVRHWTARLPGGCACARLAHPPPGLVSVTGLVVALDGVLLALALWLTALSRRDVTRPAPSGGGR